MNRLLFVMSIVAALLVLPSCDGARKRPIGWIKVGKVTELAEHTVKSDVFLESLGLFLRRDGGGFYVMSTYDTRTLDPLKARETKESLMFVCERTGSEYDVDGNVLKGPATEGLPYFNLRYDRGDYDGPVDTLYAQVGIEKPRSWRLPFPPGH